MNSQSGHGEVFARDKLEEALFLADDCNVFAVVDGAANPSLWIELQEYENACIRKGLMEDAVASVMPYVVALKLRDPSFDWFMDKCWNRSAAILIRAHCHDVLEMRKHLRRFTMVKMPDERSVYLRFYDPRVIGGLLDVFTVDQLDNFYRDIVQAFVFEDSKVSGGFRLVKHDGRA